VAGDDQFSTPHTLGCGKILKMVKCVLPVATKLYLIGLHCACQFSVHFSLISRIPGNATDELTNQITNLYDACMSGESYYLSERKSGYHFSDIPTILAS